MTLGHLLDRTAERTPNETAFICGDRTITFREFSEGSTALAGWLCENLPPKSRVAMHFGNSIELAQLYFACFKSGMVAVPINQRLKAPEIALMFEHSETSVCFSQPGLAPVTLQATALCASSIPVLSELPARPNAPLPEIDTSEPAAIMYTSGTTARPKGVVHTQSSLLATAGLMDAYVDDAGPTALSSTPMTHVSGLMCMMLPCAIHGWTNVLVPSLDPATILDTIELHQVTYTGGLPAMLTFMLAEQRRRPRNLNSLKRFISGGDSVPLPVHQQVLADFGVPIIELIAMTESVPIMCNTVTDFRPGSVGRPRGAVEVKLLPVPGSPAEIGEVAVRSPANFVGYWRDPEATAATVRDGWLHTGDLARRDEDGYYWFEGRIKQLIIRGGSNISPQQVEEVLLQHPCVFEAGVVGVPHPAWGQTVAAFVSLRDGHTLSQSELQAFARASLADYKVPEEIHFVPKLPKGPTGKVNRRSLLISVRSEVDAAQQVVEARV